MVEAGSRWHVTTFVRVCWGWGAGGRKRLCVWRDVALAHQTLPKPAEHIEAEKGVGGSCVDEQALAAVHCVLGGVR